MTTIPIACGGGESGAGPDGGGPGGGDAGPGAPDGGDTDGWQELVSGEWAMPAGNEGYYCVRKTIEQDLYVSDFRALSPEGTHHTVLTVGEPSSPDGVTRCDAGTNHNAMIYGSGVGTNPFGFPDGVAVHIPAGKQLLLNLHLFNVSDSDLEGLSGTEMRTLPEPEVEHLAEAVLAGKTYGLKVPPGESTQVGYCEMDDDVTLMSLSPHMHQLGTHMRIVAETEDGDQVLHDQPYDFYEQRVYQMDPTVDLSQGERLRIECGYDNTTGETVSFGDSSLEEMCFVGVYRYPAIGADFGFVCDDTNGI